MRRLFTALAALLAGLLLGTPALANSGPPCGISGSAAAPTTITYDPFSSTGLTQVQIPLALTRFTGANGASTQDVTFVLTKPIGSPAYTITYQGTSVLYNEGAAPNLLSGSPTSPGRIYYNFGNSSQPNSVQLPSPLVLTVPAGLDLAAGRTIDFDILYVCGGSGGMSGVGTPTKLAGAIRININVLSALQASYVGAVLDFGEVGTASTAEVQASPASYATPASGNNVRVASSGPYKVQIASQNGWKLTFSGGNVANASQTLAYNGYFLGQTVNAAAPNFATTTCSRASLSGVLLPIRARLTEGGQTKTSSPAYADVITVTVSPALDGEANQKDCAAIPLPAL